MYAARICLALTAFTASASTFAEDQQITCRIEVVDSVSGELGLVCAYRTTDGNGREIKIEDANQ